MERLLRPNLQRVVALLLSVSSGTCVAAADPSRDAAARIVVQIQHSDYEGNRSALKRLYDDLSPFLANQEIASRVRYWRGFALWRRAINGFNDGVNRSELRQDLQKALEEFNAAASQDPTFTDAKVGAIGCLSLLGYIMLEDGATFQDPEVQKTLGTMRQMRKDAEATDPNNPRLLWVMGPNVWKSPPQAGGGEAKAIAMYEKGLQEIRSRKPNPASPLEPAWGEPELLMSLAYSNLNRSTPDLNAAQQNAEAALRLIPSWHYVRDILLPQIRQAKSKSK